MEFEDDHWCRREDMSFVRSRYRYSDCQHLSHELSTDSDRRPTIQVP